MTHSPVAVEEERNGMSDIELKEDGEDLAQLIKKLRVDLAKMTEVEYSPHVACIQVGAT